MDPKLDVHGFATVDLNGVINIERIRDVLSRYTKAHGSGKNSSIVLPAGRIPIRKCIRNWSELKRHLEFFLQTRGLLTHGQRANHQLRDLPLRHIDGYVSPGSVGQEIDWHNDAAHSGIQNVDAQTLRNGQGNWCFKLFLYLTDAPIGDGCMAFMPRSHIITKSIKQYLIDHEIYLPFWSLEQVSKVLNSARDSLVGGGYLSLNDIDAFQANLSKLNQNKTFFDIPQLAGTAVIFDERILHRGGFYKSDRYVTRLLFAGSN